DGNPLRPVVERRDEGPGMAAVVRGVEEGVLDGVEDAAAVRIGPEGAAGGELDVGGEVLGFHAVIVEEIRGLLDADGGVVEGVDVAATVDGNGAAARGVVAVDGVPML